MQEFWGNKGWETADRHLLSLANMPFKRRFPFIPKTRGLYIIRGPRQIGKTCWLKTILSHYASSKSCIYLSCEEIEDFHELGTFLESVKLREIILLDEVSFVRGWDRAVKHFVDSGYSGVLCLTGSHSYDIEKGVDSMPGRFDGGGEFYLLPMDFDEFEEMRKEAGWYSGDRMTELRAYFRSGGFPTVVAQCGKNDSISKANIETFLRWLKGDAKKLGKDPDKLTEVLIQLRRALQSPISFQTLAKKTAIGSPNTIIEYLALLESSFAVRKLYAIDVDTGAFRFRKDKKFYFSDPLVFWSADYLAGQKKKLADVEEVLAEMVAHEHLARRYQRFGYHRNEQGEIDFLLPKQWCLEVKWASAALNLSRTYHKLILPQKIVWTYDNFLKEWPR